jgi:phospholipase C
MESERDEQAQTNLEKIEHLVVLMLENRSFDHMLGYLSLDGTRPDIDGLHPGLGNEYQGRTYPVHHLDSTALEMDPDHSGAAIDEQVAGGTMGGFVANAAATLASRGVQDGDPSCVMGYYDRTDVPVYDHLVEKFAVCDRWFSPVLGSTMPNRLYALCGGAAGSRDNRPPYLPPLYHQASFVRHLDAQGVSWRWYCFDPGMLRFADVYYRLGHHDRFGYFSKTGLPWRTRFDPTVNQHLPSFVEDAAGGQLPSVSWIDPAFTNFNPLGFPVNDDHPPADIRDGQDLVLAVYDALAASPQWNRSLLVIVYDEHGGFFDHVPPPAAADDDPTMFGNYGVRVPAIIVSPWVEPRAVSSAVFDHTSIIKTILVRFCPQALRDIPHRRAHQRSAGPGPRYPGRRAAEANHLGELLTRLTPRSAPRRDELIRQATARADQLEHRGSTTEDASQGGRPLNDLQRGILAATQELRRRGHPTNAP